jgi:hypothetical protein
VFNFEANRYQSLLALRLSSETELDLGGDFGGVSVRALESAEADYLRLTENVLRPQLAMLVYQVTGRIEALDHYYALTRALDEAGKMAFRALLREVAAHPNLDVRLFDERGQVLAMPALVALVAGNLAEIFFYRRDILDWFLRVPRHFWLYATPTAYQQAGGVAGGCFNPRTESVMLVLSRLFEGFNRPAPGAAPFLHEFGHMLDYASGAEGLLPGLRPADGAIYTPEARALFSRGKQMERDRYVSRQNRANRPDQPMPIGHPYVFQNNTEFIAGYLEMFFRNPHYFASLNPDLYNAFALLLKQDTRQAWTSDFDLYIQQNQGFYRSGQTPPPTRITVPAPF